MPTFDKSKVTSKPKLYTKNICKLLKVPHRPHYKCFILKKFRKLGWREQNKFLQELKKKSGMTYVSSYFIFNILEKYYLEENIIQQQTEHEFSKDQIYLEIDFDNLSKTIISIQNSSH